MLIYPNRAEFDGTCLFLQDAFSRLILRIAPWEENLKITVVRPGFNQDFHFQRENFNLLNFDQEFGSHGDGDTPIGEFLQGIPYEIKLKIRRFQYQQLQLMQLLSAMNWEVALSDENLLLLWLLVGKSAENDWDRTKQMEIISRGYDNVLEELYASPHLSKRDLKKITGDDYGEAEYNGLDFVISTGIGSRFLKRQREISTPLPRLMQRFPDMADAKILPTVLSTKQNYLDVIETVYSLSLIWSECVSLAGILGLDSTQERLNNISNQAALHRTRDRWLAQVENVEDFPSPPVEGTSAIIPVVKAVDLYTALWPMHYLAKAYIDQVYNGDIFIYAAQFPEEVLIKVDITDEGLRLGDVWSSKGEEIRPGNRLSVEEWFKQALEDWLWLDMSEGSAVKPIGDIIWLISRGYDIVPQSFLSHQLDHETNKILEMAMYICREVTGLSYPIIGNCFGGRDHEVVMRACAETEEKLETDSEINQVVSAIMQAFQRP